MEALWIALAMLLILEGVLPLVAPQVWRETFRRLIDLSDGQLRFIGLTSVAVGGVALAFYYA